jgi:Zn-dependent protease
VEREPAQQRRLVPDPRRHLDPFGTIAAAIAGVGWSRQTEVARRRASARLVVVLLSGTVANAAVGVAALVGSRLAGGVLRSGSLIDLQRGTADGRTLTGALYLFGLTNVGLALLSLVPLPPLPGGRLLLGLAPRSAGWQKAEYHLVEQNIGVGALLVGLLIPLGGPQPLLPTVLDSLLTPLLRPLVGG